MLISDVNESLTKERHKMADQTDILIGNLKETFKAIEKFLVVGFTSALVLIVLAITDRALLGTQKVMIADLNAPAVLVALVALGSYIAYLPLFTSLPEDDL
jgi:hypothetical protein